MTKFRTPSIRSSKIDTGGKLGKCLASMSESAHQSNCRKTVALWTTVGVLIPCLFFNWMSGVGLPDQCDWIYGHPLTFPITLTLGSLSAPAIVWTFLANDYTPSLLGNTLFLAVGVLINAGVYALLGVCACKLLRRLRSSRRTS